MKVDIEEIHNLKNRLWEINRLEFEDIEWYEDGKPIKYSEDLEIIKTNFCYTGLNNVDFVNFIDAETELTPEDCDSMGFGREP